MEEGLSIISLSVWALKAYCFSSLFNYERVFEMQKKKKKEILEFSSALRVDWMKLFQFT